MAVSVHDIRRKCFEVKFYIENVLVQSFCKAINTAVEEQVEHGHTSFACRIPPCVMGYPVYDAMYIAQEVRQLYKGAGYVVSGQRLDIHLAWS